MKKLLTMFVAAMMLSVTFASLLGMGAGVASAASVGATPGAIKNPNDFIGISAGEPDTLDPAVDYETAGGEILQNVYETLIWYNGSSSVELVPLLATAVPTVANGGISADGLTYTFHLKTGVQFHDGNTMTSEDVKFSIYRLLMINDPDGPAWILGEILIPGYYDLDVTNDTQAAIMAAGINSAITTPDANTVVFHLVAPAPYFLYCMAYTEASVVSKAYVMANGGVVNGTRNDWMATHTCGTGPFMLNIWQTGVQVILDRFANYHRTPAYFQHIYLKYVSDYSARKAAFISGDADWIYIPRQNMFDFISTPSNPMPEYRVAMGYPTFSLDFLGLNQNIKFPVGAPDTIPATFFANKNARLAMAAAYDYAKYNNDVMLGTSITPNGVIPMGMFGYDASVPAYEYNLTKAANYLKAIPNPAAPGQSFADTGFTISFNYNSGNTVRETSCFLLKAGLEALKTQGLINGTITVNVQALDWATYLAAVRGQQLGAFFLGWAPDYADPNDYTAPFLLSSGTYSRRCSINDPTLDAMVTAAAMELDPAVRAQMYKEMSFYVWDQALYMWTSQATNFHVEQRWVTGYQYNAMYSNMYYYPMGKVDYTTTSPDPVTNATANRQMDLGSIRLNWQPPVNDGGAPVTGYAIYRSTAPTVAKALLTTVASTARTYVDSGITLGQTYYYYIAAQNSAGTSLMSAELAAGFVSPGNPSYVAAAVKTNQTIGLAWVPPIDNGGYTITSYEIYRHIDMGNFSLLATVPGAQRTYYDTDVSVGPTYYYRVVAVNQVGESASPVVVSAGFGVPTAPRNLTTMASQGTISLNWAAPLYDGGYNVQYYWVYRSTSSDFSSPTMIGNVTGRSFVDSTAAAGQTYYYKVSAVNEIGESAMSAAATAIITVPGAPQTVTVQVQGSNISVAWTAPATTGGANITYYNVYRATSSTGLLTKVGQVNAGGALAFIDTTANPTKGTTYYYTVKAVNAAGEGAGASNQASVANDDNTMLIVAGVIIALIIIVAIVYFVMKGKKPKAPATKPEQKK